VLRDAARFASGHIGRADGIEQRGLAVIDVAHDGDDGRTRDASAPSSLLSVASVVSFAACSSKVMTSVSAPKKRAISLASSASSV
jgi:hypothetical protein